MATREQLLGQLPRKRIPTKWREYHQKLLATREALQQQQAGLTMESESAKAGTGLHMADAGSDSFNQDLALGIMSSDRDTLFQIDQALERIQNGTYGRCELTGKPIHPKRLEAVPWTRFSAEAERKLEKEGLRPRARLPDRGETAIATEAELGVNEDDE